MLWLVNFGCIEFLPWCSRVETLDWPDYAVIDLDPQDVDFNQVVAVAQTIRRLLDTIGATNCCKTSGKRGLHVCVPLGAKVKKRWGEEKVSGVKKKRRKGIRKRRKGVRSEWHCYV